MRLRFFDCNCCVGSSQKQLPETRLGTDELLRVLARCGVERALVVHAHSLELSPSEGNRRLAELCRQREELLPCFVLLPHHTGEMPGGPGLIEYLQDGGARAVRLCPGLHRYRLEEPWSGDLLATLEQAGYPVLIAATEISHEDLLQVLRDHPRLKLVLLRPWYRDARLLYPLLERYENLYVEISFYQPFRGLEDMVSRFGAGRLLFGSGMPEYDPASTVAAVRWLDVPWEDREAIAGKNLERILAGGGNGR